MIYPRISPRNFGNAIKSMVLAVYFTGSSPVSRRNREVLKTSALPFIYGLFGHFETVKIYRTDIRNIALIYEIYPRVDKSFLLYKCVLWSCVPSITQLTILSVGAFYF